MFHRSAKPVSGAVFTLLVSVLFAPSEKALAQEGAGELEEIIVTARRREESLMETPVSITAFTADDLALRQVEQSYQIGEATPNLVYRNVQNNSNVAGIIFIRGIGQGDFVPTLQPGVGTYVDGAYIANITGAVTDLVDVESISVLRGPQGTLFGRNTIGGAIQITSVKPSEEFYADIDIGVGEFSYQSFKGTVNIPFTDNFYGKFSVLSREKHGYIDTPNIPNDNGAPGDDTFAARAALRFLPNDAVTIDWTLDVTENKAGGPPSILQEIFEEIGPVPENGGMGTTPWQYNTFVQPLTGEAIADDRWAVGRGTYRKHSGFYLPADVDVVGTNLTVEWDINDNLTFKSITNRREQESIDGRDADLTPAPIQPTTDIFDGWQQSQEFQLLGSAVGGRLNWVAGLYYFEEDMLNINIVPFPIFRLTSGSHVVNDSSAMFGQFTYDVTDRFRLTLGARSTDEDFNSVVDDNIQYIHGWFCNGPSLPGPARPHCAAEGPDFVGYASIPAPPNPGHWRIIPNQVFATSESQAEPYVNLAYNFTDSVMGYVSYAEGFKGGGFTQRLPPGRPVFSFSPEFAEVYEVGVKWAGLDNRVRLTVSLFDTDYKDLQVPAASLLGSILVNAGNAEMSGGELELTAAVTERLTLALGIGTLDSKYVTFNEIDVGGDPVAVRISPENRIPDAPEQQTNASISYRHPLASGELIARLDYAATDDYFTNAQNNDGTLVPSQDVIHGGITYAHGSGDWEIALQGRNLGDEFLVYDIGGNIFSNGVILPIVSAPRELQLRFKYHFGAN